MVKVRGENKKAILYDKKEVRVCVGKDAITVQMAKAMLGWETEDDCAARLMAENEKHTNPNGKYHPIRGEQCRFRDDEVLETEGVGEYGQDEIVRVKCWNVSGLPSDKKLAKAADTSFTLPLAGCIYGRGNINGHIIAIGKTGLIRAGAKTLIAFVQNAKKGDRLEAIVLFGYTD